MTDEDRKYLAEKMGLCWHEVAKDDWYGSYCYKCKLETVDVHSRSFIVVETLRPTFNSWHDFGMVWEWAKKQEWWIKFLDQYGECWFQIKGVRASECCWKPDIIDPIRFPQLVVEFLKTEAL